MSYNESLSPNSNYPAMSQSQWDSAPFNEVDTPDKDFGVTCVQTLSKTVTVTTNNYIPGASGVDYESDGEGGYCASGWQDPDDTSDTNWKEAYRLNGYMTPMQLLEVLKGYLEQDLQNVEEIAIKRNQNKEFLERKLKFLIGECEDWTVDEEEYIEE